MSDGAASLMGMLYGHLARGTWQDKRGVNIIDGGAHFYNVYRCADGQWLAVGAMEPQFHATLVALAGLPEAEFDTQDAAQWPRLRERLAQIIATRPRAEWCALLEHTEACVTPVMSMSDAPLHPHNVARGTFATVDGVVQPQAAPRFSATPSSLRMVQSRPEKAPTAALRDWGVERKMKRAMIADIDAYLRRIGFQGEARADLAHTAEASRCCIRWRSPSRIWMPGWAGRPPRSARSGGQARAPASRRLVLRAEPAARQCAADDRVSKCRIWPPGCCGDAASTTGPRARTACCRCTATGVDGSSMPDSGCSPPPARWTLDSRQAQSTPHEQFPAATAGGRPAAGSDARAKVPHDALAAALPFRSCSHNGRWISKRPTSSCPATVRRVSCSVLVVNRRRQRDDTGCATCSWNSGIVAERSRCARSELRMN